MLKQLKVLVQDGGVTTIKFWALDISDESSIHAFRDFVKETHKEGIDVLINNAGIALTGFGIVHLLSLMKLKLMKVDANVAKDTIHTNYYGTLAMIQDFLPLLRPGGKLVNVASESGKLNKYPSALQESFIKASETSVKACSALMESFIAGVKAGKHEAEGWPSAAYAVSKAGVIAMTKAIAMEEAKNDRGILVNACCPGWVDTDMTKGKGTKTTDEGAKTPVMLALGDVGGASGQFWQNEKIIDW